MRYWQQILGVVSVCFIAGCVSSAIRLPASFKPNYNNQIVNSLKSAAMNGVLFQVSDSVFRDLPVRQVDRCRKAEAPNWGEQVTALFAILDKNPHYYNKFHIVDFKRGDHAKAEISRDIDGLSYLNITYAKRETREKVEPTTILPCAERTTEYLGKEVVVTSIDWPGSADLNSLLKHAPTKREIERFKFKTEFLVYLAERQAMLKINPEVAFERNYQGQYFLTLWLEKMSQELQEKDLDLGHLNYWLKEISTRSKQAANIQFFGLYPQSTVSYGVQVDTVGKFSRNLYGYQEPTYLFMSYRQETGDYVFNSLKELNQCLQNLTGLYRNPLSLGTAMESDGNSFLAPGYSCKVEEPTEAP